MKKLPCKIALAPHHAPKGMDWHCSNCGQYFKSHDDRPCGEVVAVRNSLVKDAKPSPSYFKVKKRKTNLSTTAVTTLPKGTTLK